MEWRKLQNLIILILLVVNSFLLVLVWNRREEAAQYERAALEQTLQVLERGGIRVDPEAALTEGLPPMAVERDLEREGALVRALLGEEVQGDNRGGGLYLYRGELGEVSVRAGGELSAILEADERWRADDDPESHAAALLRQLGVEAAQTARDDRGEDAVLRFRQSWNGAPVFSCEVELVYRDGQLCALRGSLLMAAAGTAEAGQVMTLPTALMRFSEEVGATGDVCSEIRAMEAGYRGLTQSLTGGTRLTPVWRVSTNTADYYLNCVTGALTRVAE